MIEARIKKSKHTIPHPGEKGKKMHSTVLLPLIGLGACAATYGIVKIIEASARIDRVISASKKNQVLMLDGALVIQAIKGKEQTNED